MVILDLLNLAAVMPIPDPSPIPLPTVPVSLTDEPNWAERWSAAAGVIGAMGALTAAVFAGGAYFKQGAALRSERLRSALVEAEQIDVLDRDASWRAVPSEDEFKIFGVLANRSRTWMRSVKAVGLGSGTFWHDQAGFAFEAADGHVLIPSLGPGATLTFELVSKGYSMSDVPKTHSGAQSVNPHAGIEWSDANGFRWRWTMAGVEQVTKPTIRERARRWIGGLGTVRK